LKFEFSFLGKLGALFKLGHRPLYTIVSRQQGEQLQEGKAAFYKE